MRLFDKVNLQANAWVKDMMAGMGTADPHAGLHGLRAGLHALRDQLTVDEAAQLSAQLPQLIRGLFFEGWVPRDTPSRIRDKDEFLALVRDQYAPRQDAAADVIVTALFKVLTRHVTVGELTHVVMSFPPELVEIIEGGWKRDERPLNPT